MHKLFNPESVLVIGVSPSPSNMGKNIVYNLIAHEYSGRVYLMGRKPGNVAGQPIHTSFSEIPDGVDVAVVLTPAAMVPGLVDECGKKGTRWMVIETGGFSELADDRKELENEVLEAAGRWGIRFVGPNGLGVINRARGVVLPFMRMPTLPPAGRVSLLAQSGGVGIVYLHALAAENQGLDRFVSMGNKLSLDESDFLEYIGSDGNSDVACLYLEDVRRGRRFFEVLKAFPGAVVVQKANVSEAGAVAARSHTASLSTDDRLVDAAIKQAGALRVEDMTTMVHDAMALTLPPVRGSRLLILSRSGGHAVIAADFAERAGFVLPGLPEDVAEIAAASGRAHVIGAANPLDLGDIFDLDRYAAMLERAVNSDKYDAVVFIHVFASATEGRDSELLVATAERLTKETGKPVYLCLLTEETELKRLKETYRYPLFASPESLMSAMAASRNHYRRRERIRTDVYPPPQGMNLKEVGEVLVAAGRVKDGWLGAAGVFDVIARAGFEPAPHSVVTDEAGAVRAARRIGYPVAMKVLSPDLLHKSQWGGVALNIKGDATVKEEFRVLKKRLEEVASGAAFEGVLIQKMVRGFREIFLGGRRDESFGPVVAVGIGGTYVEVLNDITFRLCPVSTGDVDEMMSEVNLFKAFRGKQGRAGGDFEYLKECVHRLSHLLVNFPQIAELDINPLKLADEGLGGVAVDARLRLEISSEQ